MTDNQNAACVSENTIIKLKRNFAKLNEISIHLMCTICQEVLDDPQRINCG